MSLSLVFDDVQRSSVFVTALIVGFLFHVAVVLKSALSVRTQDGRTHDKLVDIAGMYLTTQASTDSLILMAFLS